MGIGWFCGVCFEDFEGDVTEHWNRELDKTLCDYCKKKIESKNVIK